MTITVETVSQPAQKSKDANAASLAERVLGNAQRSRDIIQDFCLLADSLEWELGQQYLRDRGNKVFLADSSPVPFIVNNDGTLSRNAALVFFTSLVEADKAGTLENDIFVLELGIGVGLFARFFLDHFRELSRQHDKDYYDRLTYVAADKSERMLLDLCRHGVLAGHPGRYRIRQVDAMKPEELLPYDVGFSSVVGGPLSVARGPSPRDGAEARAGGARLFRAVFLNYLLDCLPAAVLDIDGQQVKQLCVRTCLARNIRLADYTDMTLEQLQERAKARGEGRGTRGEKNYQELLEVYGLFASEYDYRPVDYKRIPYGEFAYEYAHRWTKRVLHSYGAIGCLEKLLGLVHDDGFILVNDYGQTQMTRDDEFEHQRFSLATFVGLNFPLLKAYFSEQRSAVSDRQSAIGEQESAEDRLAAGGRPPAADWIEPSGEAVGIHSRLLSPRASREVRRKFEEVFSKLAHDKLQEPWQKARECVRVGRFELASGFYKEALALQPGNWVLLNEISTFLTFQLRDPKAGIDMAKVALGLNPTCSAELWNTLGDGLYEFGRTAEARSAYQKALTVNDSDVRSRYNLAWVHVREKNFPAALDMIAQALALDKTGEYRDRLLQKQQEVLAQLTLRNQQEYLLLINLVSKYAKKQTTDGTDKSESTDDNVNRRQQS